jgi:hypothetical protein
LAREQVEAAEVDEEPRPFSEEEHGMPRVTDVEDERRVSADREGPGVDRDHALGLALRRTRPDENGGGENPLPEQAVGSRRCGTIIARGLSTR